MKSETIVDKLEQALVEYLENPHRAWPSYLYCGEKECKEIDKYFGGIVFEVFHAEIVMVYKDNWLKYGE